MDSRPNASYIETLYSLYQPSHYSSHNASHHMFGMRKSRRFFINYKPNVNFCTMSF